MAMKMDVKIVRLPRLIVSHNNCHDDVDTSWRQ